MKKYKYILLDWDGNLVKTLDIWLEACRTPLKNRGLNLTDEEIAKSFGAFPTYIKQWGLSDIEAILNEADAIAMKKIPGVELYPDALQVLDSLHQAGKMLALITTSSRDNIENLLHKYNLSKYFQVIVTRDDTVNRKPHPEPLEKALELLNGNKDEAVMIGDSDKDLGAATNAGIDSILFYPKEHEKFYNIDELKTHNPTHIVEEFREILTIV